MEKEKVLVRDDKGVFLKMFEKKLGEEFDFTQTSFKGKNKAEAKNFERCIFVAYSKQEIIKFLDLDKKGVVVLVCLFDKKMFSDMSFLEEVNDLIVLDGFITKRKIIKNLKLYLTATSNFKKQTSAYNGLKSNTDKLQYHSFFKAMFLWV